MYRVRAVRLLLYALVVTFSLAACDDSEDADGPEVVASQLGIDKYRGDFAPSRTVETDNKTMFEFDGDANGGPLCIKGAKFRAHTRETGSDSLLIFLQGGGLCSEDFCLATTGAPERFPEKGDLLDPTSEINPFRDWNVTYVPYCDGSIFVGDTDRADGVDGTPNYYRGLANLTAALDVTKQQFPAPKRVVLAGASAGGFGTIIAAPLLRSYYPDADITIIDDAGVGIAKPGDNQYITDLIAELGASEFLPSDCPDCVSNGTITGLVDWYLARDPQVRVGIISSWYDGIITQVFLKIDPRRFQMALENETGALHAKYPTRYIRYIYGGIGHTATLGDVSGVIGDDILAVLLPAGLPLAQLLALTKIETIGELSVDGVLLADWLADIYGPGAWVDVVAPVGEPPTVVGE